MKKRVLAFILALSMVLNMLPGSVLTATAADGGHSSEPDKTVTCETHGTVTPVVFKVKSDMATGDHELVGTGTLYFCSECGLVCKAGDDWTGDQSLENLRDEAYFNVSDRNVYIACKEGSVFETISLSKGCVHIYQKTSTVAPTCTEDGYSMYECVNCGDTYKDDTLPKTGHKWDEGTVTKEASCVEKGEKTYQCTHEGCEEKKTEEIAIDPQKHKLAEKPISDPDCSQEKKGQKQVYCTNEGCDYNEYVEIPYEHQWVEDSHVDPTCTTDGKIEKHCSVCSKTDTEILSKTGEHTWELDSDTATCEADGIAIYKCTGDPNCTATRSEDSQKKGHNWGEWQVTTAASCSAEGEETRTCERGCIETRPLAKTAHDYDENYVCKVCGRTLDQVQEILDKIAQLPIDKDNKLSADAVNESNAQAVMNLTTEIQDLIRAIENGSDQDAKDALGKNVSAETKQGIQAEKDAAQEYLYTIDYQPTPGQQQFQVAWNDNNEEISKREPIETFLKNAKVSLSYQIVSADGSMVVSSGDLNSQADFEKAFGFIYSASGDVIPQIDDFLQIDEVGTNYVIKTNEELPVSYKSVYTDYTTLEKTTETFKVRYAITVENPVPGDYIVTLPERTKDPVTLYQDEKVILTRLATWEADIIWLDDNNRSAYGGSSTEATPRIDTDTLKAASTVYMYPEGYNVPAGDPVTGDFGYIVDDDKIRLTGLPAFDNEGNPLNYYIAQNNVDAANTDVVPGNKYTVTYENIGNVASKMNGVYNGGTVTELLTNTIPFTVSKTWVDGKEPEDRPDAKYYIWRIVEEYDGDDLQVDTEFSYAIANCREYYNVPKTGGQTSFVREIDGISYYLFPMYDNQGRKYIYFGKEKGVPNTYTTTIDNSDANASDIVKDAFDTDANRKFFLNGGKIANILGERTGLSVSKEFHALSIQNKLDHAPITATFLLQKKDREGNWVAADYEADHIDFPEGDSSVKIGDDNSVNVILTNFTAEDMSDFYGGITVDKYDADYNPYEFRFIETAVSVNDVSASYDPAKWVEDGEGGLIYKGDIIVYDGQTSTVLGDDTTQTSGADDTTALFTSVGRDNHFSNTLIGDYQVNIKKYFYDENGNNISADESMKNVTVDFQIYRDDEEYEVVTLTYADLTGPKGAEYWAKLLKYDRYDEEGREHRFKVEEIGTSDGKTWHRTENYEVKVVEYPTDSDILVKRLETIYVNGVGPGGIEFNVEKEWLDDSDLNTRYPVVAALYRFNDGNGNLLDEPELVMDNIELNLGNNWFQQKSIEKNGKNDTIDNYVVLEKGIMADGQLVPTNYDFTLTAANLKNYHDQIVNGKTPTGITGTLDAEKENWDGLEYRYKLFEQTSDEDKDGIADFLLTNLRIGTQDYILEKSWVAGGQVRKAKFGLYLSEQKIADFTIDMVGDDEVQVVGLEWNNDEYKEDYEAGNITVDVYGSGVTQVEGNFTESIAIRGLRKFDDVGAQLEYSINEIAIFNDAGREILVKNGACRVDNEIYSVGASHSVDLADSDEHRAPDLYTYKISNKLSHTYDLTSNKVWRDQTRRLYERPDVCFSVYRLSTKDEALNALLGDTEAMAAYLATKLTEENRVATDRYWDTHINDFWWTCTIENVPQYDEEGYPYVYYAVEKMSTEAVYKGYYCNYTVDDHPVDYRPINPDLATITTKDVFGVPNDDLTAKENQVFILADGINTDENGSFADYYSATAVNRPEMLRNVTGRKLWKLPADWVIPEEEMPEIKIDLYRSLDEISFSTFDSAAEYADAIKEAAKEGILETATASYGNHNYRFTFPTTAEQPLYDKFDEWGSIYYYYTLEEANNTSTFPDDKVIYEDNDFNITNVFHATPPYVEISVEKDWEISDELAAKMAEEGLDALVAADFVPAELILSGIPLNSKGTEIAKSSLKFRTVVMDPAKMGSTGWADIDEDGTMDTHYTFIPKTGSEPAKLTAVYTFRDFVNGESGEVEKLPYYWLGNNGINYYVNETHNNGYHEISSTEKVNIDPSRTDTEGVLIHYNTDPFKITNEYVGENTSFKFTKTWDDKYVDNDEWRPDQVDFVIKRKVDDTIDTDYSINVTLKKADFDKNNVWSWDSENAKDPSGQPLKLVKYDTAGKEYTYFAYSETWNGKTLTIDDVIEKKSIEDRTNGYYYLQDFSNTSLTNKLAQDVEIDATKTWTIDTESVSECDYDRFCELRAMNVFPENVKFVVQRKYTTQGESSYKNVPASEFLDEAHKVTIGDTEYVGHETDIATADEHTYQKVLAPQMKWEDLPIGQGSFVYDYRVIEILTWADGQTTTFVQTQTASEHGVVPTITSQKDGSQYTVSMQNDIQPKKVKIAKKWLDDNGNQNTRPETIDVTIKPLDASGKAVTDGLSFTLEAQGNAMSSADANMYYSEEFYVPANVDMTYGVNDAKYQITESFETPHGEVYQKTITSDNGHVYQKDGTWIFEIVNTWDVVKKTIDLDATKNWSGDSSPNWADITRPAVAFKLQYYDRTAKKWTDMTKGDASRASDISQFTTETDQDVQQTVTYNATTKKYSVVGWDKLKKYWDTISQDGVAEKIRYRASEVIGTSSYSHSDKEYSFEDGSTTATVEIKNTISKQTISVKKNWTENGETMSGEELAKLINLNAVPEKITFEIQYHLDGETEWKKIPETSSVSASKTYNTLDIYNGSVSTGRNVPRYDRNGKNIYYRVVETRVTYKDQTSYDVVYDGNTGTIGSITAQIQEFAGLTGSKALAFTNGYDYTEKSLTKTWRDEKDRDKTRKDVRFTLYRDGEEYCTIDTSGLGEGTTVITTDAAICTVTKNTDDTWTVKWDKLPMYQNGKQPAEENKSVYTWAETTGADNYSISYSETASDQSAPVSGNKVWNTYQPKRGKMTAVKNWVDDGNLMNSRPEKIYLKLQYKNAGGTFVDVTKNELITLDGKTLYKDADPAASYTTSETGWREVTKTNWISASWENLPVYMNVNGTRSAIVYHVIEGKKNADGGITALASGSKLNGYTVTYSNVSFADKDGDTRNDTVKNTLDRTTLAVEKQWDDVLSSLVRPNAVTFAIEYKKTTETEWKPIPAGIDDDNIEYTEGTDGNAAVSYVVVTGSDNWKKTVSNLPHLDADGTEYEYRITEDKISYSWGDVVANDDQKIVGPYSMENVVNQATFANGKYTVSEKNTLDTGKLTVVKNWKDSSNRDDGRKEIKVRLYRENKITVNGASVTETQIVGDSTLNSTNSWTYTWDKLPIRNNNVDDSSVTADASVYYVRELDANGNPIDPNGSYIGSNNVDFKVTYSDKVTVDASETAEQKVTNTHKPKVFHVDAAKDWGNDKDKIDVRPETIRFKLQYSLDGSAWTDFPAANIIRSSDLSVLTEKDAENVYMVDEAATVTQTLSDSNNWKVQWKNLTAYVMVNGVRTKVKYRAIELTDDLKNYKPGAEGKSEAVDVDSTGETTKSVTISNELIRGSITADKKFTANKGDLSADQLYKLVKVYKVLPEKLKVTLSYMDGTTQKKEYGEIVFDASKKAYGTCTFENLPIYDAAGGKISYSLSDDAEGYDFIEYGTTTVTINSETSAEKATLINDFETGSLAVEKKWIDDGNRDGGRKEITVTLYRDGEKMEEQKLNKENNWKYTWTDLPIWQKQKDEEDNELYKSTYTIKEAGETELKFTGDNNVVYDVTYDTPLELKKGQTETASVINEHDEYRFAIIANKKWLGDTSGDPYHQRPDISLKLQWTTKTNPSENDWKDVQHEVDNLNPDGKNVGTSSEEVQSLRRSDNEGKDVWTQCKWENLPANVLDETEGALVTTPVYYRAIEVAVIAPMYTSLKSQIMSYSGKKEATVVVENTIDPTTFTVEKKWNDVEQVARPDEIKVVLQYKTSADGDWITPEETEANAAYYATLNADNGWKYSWAKLRKDYSYRALELSMTYKGKGEGGTDIVVTPASGQITEGTIGAYDFSDTTKAADQATKTEITNKLITGKLQIKKVWQDGENRDDFRPTTLTFNIYRDGSKNVYASQTVDVAADGSIDCIFENLPVYKNFQGTEKSAYKVEEIAVDNYEIAYEADSDSLKLDKTTTKGTTVTNKHDNLRFTVHATKTWDDTSDFYGLRPEEVALKLQYSLDGSTWKDVEETASVPTPAADEGEKVYTTSELVQTLTKEDADTTGNVWGTAEWKNLPANAFDEDGLSILVKYKVVEAEKPSASYTITASGVLTYTDAKTNADLAVDGDVKNTLTGMTEVDVQKTWSGDKEGYVEKLPDQIEVLLEYASVKDPAEADWKPVPSNNTRYLTKANDWKASWKELRDDYQYRVVEKSMTFGDTKIDAHKGTTELEGTIGGYDFTTDVAAGEAGKATNVIIDNKLIVGKLAVTKAWEDAKDRDGIRPKTLTFHLFRDGKEIADKTANVTAEGIQTCVFTDLPVYRDGTTTKSAYYVTETAVDEYTTSYKVTADDTIKLVQNETAEAAVTNKHEVHLFNIQTTKFWDDNKDPYGLRPGSVVLKLQWTTKKDAGKDDDSWADVEMINAVPDPKEDDGTMVYTTSELEQELKAGEIIGPDGNPVWGPARWENLPENVLVNVEKDGGELAIASQKVYYRVIEAVTPSAAYESYQAGPVSYDDATEGEVDIKGADGVTNKLEHTVDISIEKNWDDDEELYMHRPDSIKVQLQYREDAANAWKDTPETIKDGKPYNKGTQYLTKENNWKFTWDALRADYDYRVVERSMMYGEVEITADPIDDGMNGQIGGYNYTTIAKPGDSPAVTDYEVTNDLIRGQLAVTKSWTDCLDRDGLRPETLTFELYRDVDPAEITEDAEDAPTPIAVKEVQVTADGIEPCVFDKLPVYKDGTKELSEYYVVEKDVDGYVTSYEVTLDDPVNLVFDPETGTYTAETPIDNRHESLRFNIEATKTWEDQDDQYGMRPDSVALRLVYAFDPEAEDWTDVTVVDEVPGPDTDDGTVVFTTSELVQTLTADDVLEDENVWGTVRWENLPGFALTEEDGVKVSRPVYYKVVEDEIPSTSYDSIEMGPVSYDDAKETEDLTVAGTVTNPLTSVTFLETEKTWVDNKQKQLRGYIATKVNVVLQYRTDADAQWQQVPKNSEAVLTEDNNWTYTWEDLRDDYQYRCIEISYQRGSTTYKADPALKNEGYTYETSIGEFAASAQTKTSRTEDGSRIYQTELINKLNDHPGPKTGDDSDFRLFGSLLATSFFGLLACAFIARKRREETETE